MLGFSLFYIQASGKSDIENQLSVKSEQEDLPQSHQAYTQPADGLRFTIKNTEGTSQKNNTHVRTGVVSTKKTNNKDVDETLIEDIISKYTNGLPLSVVETKILKDNINELRAETVSYTHLTLTTICRV